MAELLSGKALFPGADRKILFGSNSRSCLIAHLVDITQLNLILDLVGTPGEKLLNKIESDDVSCATAERGP